MDIKRQVFRLDDSVIAQIAKLVQIGFATGTDVTDYFRELVMEADPKRESHLVLTPEYKEKHAKDIDSMFDHLEELMEVQKN